MPVYEIPPAAKRFEVVRSKAGEYMVVSATTGGAGVAIPARDESHANEICGKLNCGEHDGTIEVRQFD